MDVSHDIFWFFSLLFSRNFYYFLIDIGRISEKKDEVDWGMEDNGLGKGLD